MKRIFLIAMSGAAVLLSMSAVASSSSWPIVIATEDARITVLVDRFALEVRAFKEFVASVQARDPLPVATADRDLYAERAKARHDAYMAAGEQLVAPKNNAGIGFHRRL
jgi:hypothetical protein